MRKPLRGFKEKGVAIQFGDDFGSEEETILAQSFDRPVLVHRYPAAAKAFYMARDPERSGLSLVYGYVSPRRLWRDYWRWTAHS